MNYLDRDELELVDEHERESDDDSYDELELNLEYLRFIFISGGVGIPLWVELDFFMSFRVTFTSVEYDVCFLFVADVVFRLLVTSDVVVSLFKGLIFLLLFLLLLSYCLNLMWLRDIKKERESKREKKKKV